MSRGTVKVWKTAGVWACFIPLAILNGGMREHVLDKALGASWALPASGVLLSLLIFLAALVLLPRVGRMSLKESWQTGWLWLLLTLAFELAFGLAEGLRWEELRAAYHPETGNLWVVVLATTWLSPVGVYVVKRKRKHRKMKKGNRLKSKGWITLVVTALLVWAGSDWRVRTWVEVWMDGKRPSLSAKDLQWGRPSSADAEETEVGLPDLLEKRSGQVIRHKGYVVSYNERTKQPNWVAWTLTPERFKEVAGRSDKFLPDPAVDRPVTTEDYKHSGYDRGHICPAADNKWDVQAMRESFYMTNICPQNHNLNGGDWKELEEACRDWAMECGRLYVVGGPVFEGAPRKHIGDSRVAVPDAFFKVVLCLAPPKAIGFVFENRAGSRPLRAYVRTVDEVEQLTGMDFFPGLADSVELAVETTCALGDWML